MVRTKFSSRLTRLVASVAFVISGLAGLPSAAQTPSPEQIDIFRTLPPDQQKMIMEQMNRGGSVSTARPDRELDFPQTIMQPKRERRPLDGDEDEQEYGPDGQPLPPRMKAEDSVLLMLDIRQFERRAPEIEESERRQQQAQKDATQPAVPGRPRARPVGAPPAQPQAQNQQRAGAGAGAREPMMVERTEEEVSRLEDFRDRISRRNPYKLDKWGILNVPELGPIPLAGLTVDEATERIAAELRLKDFIIRLVRLPLKPTGTAALKPFGYDLFRGMPSTFAPATDVPVPSEYIVGPGDTLEVLLVGSHKGKQLLVVGRDGRINFPELGPISVGGRRFDEVRAEIESRVASGMIGTTVSIGIGELRSIRVFVLGDAQTPGSYTVSGLSTITNALFVSGGVKRIGSLRNIELKRNGHTVGKLDLYDLLLKGDTSADVRLLPGDVIFVPPVGRTVGLSGQVRRPAIYELKSETTVEELIQLGGGLLPDADSSMTTIERINANRTRVVVDADLTTPDGKSLKLMTGDVVRVALVRPVLDDAVTVQGFVHRPGEYEYRAGMHIADVLPTLDDLKPGADQRYLLVRREIAEGRRIRVFSADLERALADPTSAANFELAPRDQIFVFDRESGRDRIIEPLMRELQLQSNAGEPTQEVSVAGKVKVPGKYPLEPGMRVSDLLRAGGGLDEAAHGKKAELARYEIVDGDSRQAQLIEIDLDALLAGDRAADLALRPFDYIVIKEVPLWAAQEEVEIRGEVKFPGRYPIHRGETLRSLMARAGGLTDLAFAEGAIFTRDELKERERKQLETLAVRMESDLAQVSLMSAQETGKDAGQALAIGNSLLASLREAKPVGRLVIDLERSARAQPGSEHDIVLKNGDKLMVPRITQEVTVIGEVQSTTSHLYRADLSRDDYIAMSGGLTPRADEKRIYVVRADGSVVTRGGSWFGGSGATIKTGDTIVAPLDTERMRPLPFWTAVTTIVYNLAISAAAVNSF